MASTYTIISFFILAFFVSIAILTPLTIIAQPSEELFNSVRHLDGCHKGQTVTGISALKKRLIRFGYLDDYASDLTDEFDELLESALKTYQENYHLNVTGTLDQDTLKDMMLPTCGNPDIFKNTKEKHQHARSSKFFHVTKNYVLSGHKWPTGKTKLTYSFVSSAAAVVGEQTLKSVCGRAFKKWADVTQFTFEEAPQGLQGDLEIGFHRGAHGDGAINNFDGRGSTTAHAFYPPIGMCHFDADENWSENPTSMSELDLESVATHEIGHLLGLDHSLDSSAVMHRHFEYGVDVKRDLTQDDINGIRALYP